MTVRAATASDIELLSEYWYDQTALRSQKHASVKLALNAEQQWRDYAYSLLETPNTVFLVSEIDSEVIGCAIGRIQPNEMGLVPAQIGLIESIILDLHSPHKRKNAVTDLLAALQVYFRQSEIQHIMVNVPIYDPVEQGFWRGLGLLHIKDTFWMDLDT